LKNFTSEPDLLVNMIIRKKSFIIIKNEDDKIVVIVWICWSWSV